MQRGARIALLTLLRNRVHQEKASTNRPDALHQLRGLLRRRLAMRSLVWRKIELQPQFALIVYRALFRAFRKILQQEPYRG